MRVFVIVFLFCCQMFSQQIQSKEVNFNNLSFLKDAIKDANVVMLGEASHFEGNVFEFRTKLIEYLHKELGFNTIAFESGIFDVYKAKLAITKGEKASAVLRQALMPHWANASEFESLNNLVEKNNINIFGFDPQFSGAYSKEYFINDFKSFCKKHQFKNQPNDALIDALEPLIFSYKFLSKKLSYDNFQVKVNNILKEIELLPNTEEKYYWKNFIKGILVISKDVNLYPTEFPTVYVLSKMDSLRDEQMAKNLLSYIKLHPNEKIICIGANAHFINSLKELNEQSLKDVKPMGAYLKEVLLDKMYTLALVTGCKEMTINNQLHKIPLEANSIESFIDENSDKRLFINTHQKIFKKPIRNRFLSNETFINASLDKMYDGIIGFSKCTPYTAYEYSAKNKVSKMKIISGTLIDKSNNQPIVYAVLKTKDAAYGGYSNENGEFSLSVPKNKKVINLLVENYGFEEAIVPVNKVIKLDLIPLKEKSELLNEVVVKGRLSASKVVADAISKIDKNHLRYGYAVDRVTEGKWIENDSTYLHFKLEIEDAKKTKKGAKRYDLKKLEKYVGIDTIMNSPSYPFGGGTLFYPVLNKIKSKKFVFKHEKDSVINGEEVYKIKFSTPKKFMTYTYNRSLSNYTGELFISKKTKAFVYLKHFWDMSFYNNTETFIGWWYVPKKYSTKVKTKRANKYFLFKKDERTKKYLLHNMDLEVWGSYKAGKKLHSKMITNWIRYKTL